MEITAENLLASIKRKEEIPGVVIVWGEEDYFKEIVTQELISAVFAGVDARDRSVGVFEKDVSLPELAAAVNSYPFFSGKSVILLKEPRMLKQDKQQDSESRKEEQLKLAEILGNVPDFCQVVCLVTKLDKRSKFYKRMQTVAGIVESKSLKVYNLKPWLEQEAAKYGCQWDRGAAELIIEYMSDTENVPLVLLSKEIEKLYVYAGLRKSWTREDVGQIFAELPEVSAFALNNAIAEKRMTSMLSLLALEEKRGTNVLRISAMVSSQLRRLLQVKEMAEAGAGREEIASELKMHPFVVQKTMAQTRNFSIQSLEECLTGMARLNVELRKGGRRLRLLEELLIVLLRAESGKG